jgi:hypothetical protein
MRASCFITSTLFIAFAASAPLKRPDTTGSIAEVLSNYPKGGSVISATVRSETKREFLDLDTRSMRTRPTDSVIIKRQDDLEGGELADINIVEVVEGDDGDDFFSQPDVEDIGADTGDDEDSKEDVEQEEEADEGDDSDSEGDDSDSDGDEFDFEEGEGPDFEQSDDASDEDQDVANAEGVNDFVGDVGTDAVEA